MLNRASPNDGGGSRAEPAAEWIGRARALAPLIEAAAPRVESERIIPPDVLAALHQARLLRMLIPRACDGGEVDPATFAQVVEEIAKADASAAWCVAQGSGCSMAAAYLEPRVAREIFGSADAVLAWGPTGTNAKAVQVDGGYRVSGKWMFASGSRHAAWIGGHCSLCAPDGTPVLDAGGRPVERTVLFPKAKATMIDVWQVIGLKGTGTDNYQVEDLFVPAPYSFTREAASDRREAGPLYRFTTFHLFGIGFAGVALGIGRATLDAFIRLAAEKTPMTKAQVLRDNAVIQAQVARSEAALSAARVYLLEVLDELWETASSGAPFAREQLARLRLAATYAIHQAKDVVDACYHAAGATAIFESNPFERRFRDMHTVSQQVQAQAANFELVGQVLLGLKPNSKLL